MKKYILPTIQILEYNEHDVLSASAVFNSNGEMVWNDVFE